MIDARIKIRHLQCFLETARLRHVGRAADRLCVTQPAVSKTIRELEDILAVQLFERSGRGLALTRSDACFRNMPRPASPRCSRRSTASLSAACRAEPCCASGPCPPSRRA